ncbi:hypothetical protein [Metamycoplasma equirhinis]|uniref:hypothetical protein n=1 Tax=Metamycoplasma equirhinis TaxID=92402 RepID=UPI00359CA231
MKILNHKNELFELLNNSLIEYNKKNTTNLSLIITGSYALSEYKLTNRKPNDIDLSFVGNTNFYVEKDFIYFLNSKINSFIEREDDNLITLNSTKFGKIEFVLFNHIDKSWIKPINEFLYIVDSIFLILGKITMLNYIMSDYYLHNDKYEKITNTLNDIIFIDNKINFFENVNYEEIKPYLFAIINNSCLIFIYYKYDKFLWWQKYNYFIEQNKIFMPIFLKINDFFENIKKIKNITNFISFNEILVKNFHDGFMEKIINDYDFISPSGNEDIFINKIFNNVNKINGGYILNENETSNLLFISHSDEATGILVNDQIYNLGTINWKPTNNLDLYDIKGNKIYQNIKFKINDNYIFSSEKNIKINRPKIEFLNKNEIKLNNKQPYFIVSNEKSKIKNFNFSNRNNDNKINVFLLKWVIQNFTKIPNILLTKSEEVGLSGIKSLKKNIKSNMCVNFEVSEQDNWEKHGILIRIADFFTPLKIDFFDKISNLLNIYSIPYDIYYGSGSTDITELNDINNSITIAIPSNSIHSMSSMINIINIVYLLKSIWILNENLN